MDLAKMQTRGGGGAKSQKFCRRHLSIALYQNSLLRTCCSPSSAPSFTSRPAPSSSASGPSRSLKEPSRNDVRKPLRVIGTLTKPIRSIICYWHSPPMRTSIMDDLTRRLRQLPHLRSHRRLAHDLPDPHAPRDSPPIPLHEE